MKPVDQAGPDFEISSQPYPLFKRSLTTISVTQTKGILFNIWPQILYHYVLDIILQMISDVMSWTVRPDEPKQVETCGEILCTWIVFFL